MTNDDIRAIEEIQGTAGFRVIQSLVEKKLEGVKDVNNIKPDGLVAEQTIARQLAYEVLKAFLSDLKLTSPLPKDSKKTYE